MFRGLALVLAVTACRHDGAHAPAPAPRHPAATVARARLTPGLVLETVTTRYLPSLRRCYEQQIKHARLRGRMTLSFTIDDRGHVTDASATGLAPKLDACVEQRMLAWTFAAPPAEASFRIPVQLDVL